jgi:hypothetical protein
MLAQKAEYGTGTSFGRLSRTQGYVLFAALPMKILTDIALHLLSLGVYHRRLYRSQLWNIDLERLGICKSTWRE